jgi:hypothetical protein
MFRLIVLAALFAALACSSQEEGSDVGAAGEPAAEVSGEALVSAFEGQDAGVDPAPTAEAGAVVADNAVVAEKQLPE